MWAGFWASFGANAVVGSLMVLGGAEPPDATAAEPPTVGAEDDVADPAVDASRAAFERGITMYETQRFDEAIEAFTEAFTEAASIDDAELRARSSSTMLFNLARAHVGAYDVDRDVEHLRQAEKLMLKYREGTREQGGDPDSDTDLRRLEQEITSRLEGIEADAPGEATDTERRPKKSLLWAGVGVTSGAAVGLGVMTTGLVLGNGAEQDYLDETTAQGRKDADRRGRNANTIAIAGGIGAGVLAAVGVGLIAAAYGRKDTRSEGRQAKVRVSPTWSRSTAGVAIGGAF